MNIDFPSPLLSSPLHLIFLMIYWLIGESISIIFLFFLNAACLRHIIMNNGWVVRFRYIILCNKIGVKPFFSFFSLLAGEW